VETLLISDLAPVNHDSPVCSTLSDAAGQAGTKLVEQMLDMISSNPFLTSRGAEERLKGRTLIRSALASPDDIKVKDQELPLTLASMSSAHRTRAIAAPCDELNKSDTFFRGSNLRFRYTVRHAS
jgi:hypothetical protein